MKVLDSKQNSRKGFRKSWTAGSDEEGTDEPPVGASQRRVPCDWTS